jgi:hypothetical protein
MKSMGRAIRGFMPGEIGMFTEPGQETPAHAPPFPIPCPVCGLEVNEENVRTISACPVLGDRRVSVFYRMHRDCDDAQSDEERGELDEMAMLEGVRVSKEHLS